MVNKVLQHFDGKQVYHFQMTYCTYVLHTEMKFLFVYIWLCSPLLHVYSILLLILTLGKICKNFLLHTVVCLAAWKINVKQVSCSTFWLFYPHHKTSRAPNCKKKILNLKKIHWMFPKHLTKYGHDKWGVLSGNLFENTKKTMKTIWKMKNIDFVHICYSFLFGCGQRTGTGNGRYEY